MSRHCPDINSVLLGSSTGREALVGLKLSDGRGGSRGRVKTHCGEDKKPRGKERFRERNQTKVDSVSLWW